MKRWIIIDLILVGLFIAALYYMKRAIEHQADLQMQQQQICPEWLQDQPQKGCEK